MLRRPGRVAERSPGSVTAVGERGVAARPGWMPSVAASVAGGLTQAREIVVPELPEVETIRRMIERELVGLTLEGVELTLPKLMRDSPLPTLEPLVGHTLLRARASRQGARHRLERRPELADAFQAGRSTGSYSTRRASASSPGTRCLILRPFYPHKSTHLTCGSPTAPSSTTATSGSSVGGASCPPPTSRPRWRCSALVRKAPVRPASIGRTSPASWRGGALRSNPRCSISGSSPASATSTSTRRSTARASTPPGRRTASQQRKPSACMRPSAGPSIAASSRAERPSGAAGLSARWVSRRARPQGRTVHHLRHDDRQDPRRRPRHVSLPELPRHE